MKTVTIIPISKRELNVVRNHGASDWVLLKEGNPVCFQFRDALMVQKNNHMRWILKEQTLEVEGTEHVKD
jgi:hypothetical protein